MGYGLWESEEKMANAMPLMIGLLDSTRQLLEKLSPELGVTDPVSDAVVFEKKIDVAIANRVIMSGNIADPCTVKI